MALNLSVNGTIYRYPEQGDINWGQATTLWAQAVTTGMLQKAGGSFPLTANVDFGANFGLFSSFYASRSSFTAQTGAIRLGHDDFIAFRNTGNTIDLPLSINSSDELTFNGVALITGATTNITNANIASNAAIAFSKMAALTASRALVSDGSGVIGVSSTTSTQVGYLSTTTSDVQIQIDSKLNVAGGTMLGALILDGNPSLALQAVPKQYVDNAMLGISPKAAVIAATTGPGTLATDFENGDTIDGVVLTTGDRILIKDQVAPAENGIYIVAASGAPTRSTDADTWAELVQAYTLVEQGTTLIGSGWLCTASPGGTINVDPVIFNQFSSATQYTADGQGIELTGTQFSLKLDGSTLSKSSAGLRVAASVISDIAAKLTNVLTTTGDIVIANPSSTPVRLPIGTTGQMLTVSGGLPSWQTLQTNPTIVSLAGNVTLTAADSNKVYLVNTGAARSITLPTPAAGLNFYIKDSTGTCATNNISIIRAATEQIEGVAATKILQTNWGSWRIISDGTNWFFIG